MFDDPATVSVEYGEAWGFSAHASATYLIGTPWTGTAQFHGGPGGYTPAVYSDQNNATSTTTVWVYPANELPALTAGNYTIDATVTNFDGTSYTTTTPASLVVTRAALGIDLRVLADPNNSDAAIVTARFTGRFVDEYSSSFYESAPRSPAGEWHITIKDDEGAIAIERNFERAAGDDVLATSFYWTGAQPDKEYSATAEFVATGPSASNFEVASATAFAYTAPVSQRPVPTSTATAKPAADLPEASGFGLPLWALILIVVLTLGLGVLVAIFSVRLSKTTASSGTGTVTA